MKNVKEFEPKRRIYLDLNITVADQAKEKAWKARIAMKRYVELLIERDCAKVTKQK